MNLVVSGPSRGAMEHAATNRVVAAQRFPRADARTLLTGSEAGRTWVTAITPLLATLVRPT
jgi:hypothetical protein